MSNTTNSILAQTDAQRRTLAAAMNRIIPEDDYPGAWAAGAGDYIDRILQDNLRQLAAAFHQGLADLDAEAVARFGQHFASLTPENQDAVLTAIEAGEVAASWQNSPREFFRLLVELTAEGYYSDPQSGGNRGMISWKMVGFDPKYHERY